ncbi:MAG TPA: MarR family transcriptional regulator [Roseiarcus sp.]|nr:MarR family transcriptional regulator [Roseiarcus sp.]
MSTATRRTKAFPVEKEAAPSERASIDYGPLDRRLGYALRRAQIAVFRDFFAAFESLDIRPGQYSILTIIEHNPGLKQSEVSEALGIKRTNFVAMIDELERRKLVRRAPTPNDRRSNALMLTEAGKRLMKELHAVSERHERRIVDALGADTHRRMFAWLKALAEMGEAGG